MKNMRKICAMVLAVMMVLTLATTAFADGPYTLTLNGAQEGHTYTAYQIFAGDLDVTDPENPILSNIVWGTGVTPEGRTALGNAAAKAESLKTTTDAENFAAAVAPYLTGGTASSAVSGGNCTITGLEAGYYLVKTTATSATNDVYTYYIMKIVKDTSATIKADVPELDKTVDDNDANIGDTVTFTLTATMPSDLQGYETYKVIFHDTLSAGLDYVEKSAKVTVAGADKTSEFTITEENGTLTISCNDVLALGATASSQIVVTYDAVLDADAVIGKDGNPNTVYLEYSNDPNWTGEPKDEPTGNTPQDEVKVYTWQIPVFKYTGTNTPLAGAGFTLYTDAGCTKPVNLVAAGTNVAGDLIYKVCTKDDSPATHTHVNEIVTGTTGKFEIEGLEKGTYYLKETTVPAGYNSVSNVTVVIGDDGDLTIGGDTVDIVSVLNQAGSTLPETGGMGTTLFYVFGSVMVVAAVVLLVTKKRMAS